MAEAIAKKNSIIASSSGILVLDRGYNKLSWPTTYLAKIHNLTEYLPTKVRQTDPRKINTNTHVVFISSKNQQRFLDKFGFLPPYSKVWEIADIPDFDQNKNSSDPTIIKSIQLAANNIYKQIQAKLID